jgi:Ca2+-binding RTX toxin-like protein
MNIRRTVLPATIAAIAITAAIVGGSFAVGADREPPAAAARAPELCDGMVPTMRGTDRADDLQGTDRSDVILAGAGDDTVHGGDGSDVICGNNGADKIYGQAGLDDIMWGGTGNDMLDGHENVPVVGESQYDELHGGPNADTLKGVDGGARIWGGDGPDVITGDSNGVGGGVKFEICGEAGDDTISGTAEQADKLSGGSGHDIGNAGEAIIHSPKTDHCHSIEEEHGCEVSDANEGCFG